MKNVRLTLALAVTLLASLNSCKDKEINDNEELTQEKKGKESYLLILRKRVLEILSFNICIVNNLQSIKPHLLTYNYAAFLGFFNISNSACAAF